LERIVEHPLLKFERGKKIVFYFEDVQMQAYEGESIAAALNANGVRMLRITPKGSRPQGLFCAIGKCSSCLMEVDGKANVRTCITPVKEGMRVRKQKGRGEKSE
jgi:sarcosine oxidase subunit alpha